MAFQPGDRFGRYELVSLLGRGGMAETWRARLVGDAGVTKPVLIKKVLPEYANDEAFISMFISEARISATLSHGSIAQVHDFGRVDSEYFLAMEFVDGQPLHRVLKRARNTGLPGLPIPLATFTGLELCRGLHYAHTRTGESGKPLGIVHRDISPDNVLISYEGQIKIVDFGIAKARELRGFNTEPGIVKGKYLFFSPEQAKGEEVDARTDVWATGVVLYEMLCGRLPVEGQPYVALPKLIQGEFPRPSVLNPQVPSELDAIVMRALTVSRDERFESSHAFGDALAGFLYASNPRFSTMSLMHFIRELFREELAAEGRPVEIPATFREQLARWRNPEPVPSSPPPQKKPAPLQTGPLPEAVSIPGVLRTVSERSPRVLWGLGLVVVLVLLLTGVLLIPGEPPPAVSRITPFRQQAAPVAPPQAQAPAPPAATPPPAALGAEARAEPRAEPVAPPPPVPSGFSFPAHASQQTFSLESQRNVVRISGVGNSAPLKGSHYWLSEPSPPRNVPPLFYWLEEPFDSDLPDIGRLGKKRLLVFAHSVRFFTLEPPPRGSPARTVIIEDSLSGKRTRLKVLPTAVASLEDALTVRGLDPAATYELQLLQDDSGSAVTQTRNVWQDGAFAHAVACVRQPDPLKATPHLPSATSQPRHFVLQTGASLRISGSTGLTCGFVDEDPSNNAGRLQLQMQRIP